MDLLLGLLGALIGGLFVLAGSFLQGHFQSKQAQAQFEHERRLAAQEHERRQVWSENEKLRGRVQAQIAYGRSILVAAARFQAYAEEAKERHDPTKILYEALRFVGLDWDQPRPQSFLQPEEIEDSELRDVLSEHGHTVEDVEWRLVTADRYPAKLPADCMDVLHQLDDLSHRIDLRCRVLLREGKPF